jgi:hypothetical protein
MNTKLPQSTDKVQCRFCWWKIPRITRQKYAGRSGYYLLSQHIRDMHLDEYREIASAELAFLESEGVEVQNPEIVLGSLEADEAMHWRQDG